MAIDPIRKIKPTAGAVKSQIGEGGNGKGYSPGFQRFIKKAIEDEADKLKSEEENNSSKKKTKCINMLAMQNSYNKLALTNDIAIQTKPENVQKAYAESIAIKQSQFNTKG